MYTHHFTIAFPETIHLRTKHKPRPKARLDYFKGKSIFYLFTNKGTLCIHMRGIAEDTLNVLKSLESGLSQLTFLRDICYDIYVGNYALEN